MIAGSWRQLFRVAVALAYWTAVGLGGSGFIAAFVAGLLFGTLLREDTGEITIFTDEAGALRDGVTFLSSAPRSPDPRSRMSPGRWPSTPPSA
jgi:sodium/hydrogen antiporter